MIAIMSTPRHVHLPLGDAYTQQQAVLAICRRLRERGVTQAALAQAVGKSQAWISSELLADPRKVVKRLWVTDRPGLAELERALQWSEGELLGQLGVAIPSTAEYAPSRFIPQSDQMQNPGRSINVYAAGTGPARDLQDVLEVAYLPEGMYPNQDMVGLKAMGDSMAPYLPRNAIAVIVLDDGLVDQGDYCGVWLSDDGVVIKRFVQESSTRDLLLESLNPDPGEPRLFTAPLGSRIMGRVDRRILEG